MLLPVCQCAVLFLKAETSVKTFKNLTLLIAVAFSLYGTAHAAPADRATAIMKRIDNPQGGLIVIAHRGCHNPAPHHALPSAPENSLLGLQHCLAMGADVMETDVRRTADGHLVMIHDDSVDRTTDGMGPVDDLTLAQIQALHLRDNEGGKTAMLTDQKVPTLHEMLAAAKGRIVLNLDVKASIYAEVVAAVERAGMTGQVLIKSYAGPGSPPLAEIAPFDRVPFLPMITQGENRAIEAAINTQVSGRVKPVGIELPKTKRADIGALTKAAHTAGVRLWANSLNDGNVPDAGGDIDALRDPEAVWGEYYRLGITMIQTDEPEALLRFADTGR